METVEWDEIKDDVESIEMSCEAAEEMVDRLGVNMDPEELQRKLKDI